MLGSVLHKPVSSSIHSFSMTPYFSYQTRQGTITLQYQLALCDLMQCCVVNHEQMYFYNSSLCCAANNSLDIYKRNVNHIIPSFSTQAKYIPKTTFPQLDPRNVHGAIITTMTQGKVRMTGSLSERNGGFKWLELKYLSLMKFTKTYGHENPFPGHLPGPCKRQ